MKQPNCFFIVYGKEIKSDFSNVRSISTTVIPNIGESFVFKNEIFHVKDKVINYKNVEDYDLEDKGRGKELIYVFV